MSNIELYTTYTREWIVCASVIYCHLIDVVRLEYYLQAYYKSLLALRKGNIYIGQTSWIINQKLSNPLKQCRQEPEGNFLHKFQNPCQREIKQKKGREPEALMVLFQSLLCMDKKELLLPWVGADAVLSPDEFLSLKTTWMRHPQMADSLFHCLPCSAHCSRMMERSSEQGFQTV